MKTAGRLALQQGIAASLALVLFGVAVYAPSFQNPFIWDDQYLITDNHLIRSFAHLPTAFRQHLYYSTAGLSNFYRPMQIALLMADWALWKTDPFGYHLTSFLTHLLCACAAYLVISSLFGRRGLAALVSGLFLVHPVNSTVVYYISSRADSQAAFGMLLAFWLFFSSERKVQQAPGAFRSGRGLSPVHVAVSQVEPMRYTVSLLGFTLALLSKELAVILPVWLLASARLLGRRMVRWTIPFFAILGFYAVVRLTVLSFPSATALTPPALGTRLLTTCEAFVRLIGLLVVPTQIHIEKSLPFSTGLFQPSTFVSILALGAMGCFAWWVRRRSIICAFGLAWFLITLLPMANLMPINATMADHWLYLPSLGMFLAILGGLGDWIQKGPLPGQRRWLRGASLLYAAAVIVYSARTIRQNDVWKDPERFFQLAIQYSPGSFRAHNELGVIHFERQQFDRAIRHFQQAIAINPAFDQAYDNLGTAYDHVGELDQAIASHKTALQLNPYNPKTYNNLGNAYFKSNQLDKAIEAYQRALQLNPQYKAVYNNLGAVYYRKGEFDQAKAFWEKALKIDPAFQQAADNLHLLRRIQEGRSSR